MIEIVLKNVEAVNKAISILGPQHRSKVAPIGQTDVAALRELAATLLPFAEATIDTEGDNVVTVSLIVPYIVGMKRCINDLIEESPRFTVQLCHALNASIEKRLNQFLTLDNKVAAVLNPSLRTTGLGEVADSEAKDEIRRRIAIIASIDDTSSGESGDDDLVPVAVPNPGKRLRLLKFLDEDTRERRVQQCPKSTKAEETYFRDPRSQSVDPLQFWKTIGNTEGRHCAALATVAKDALGVTATSASSERLFSVAGNINRIKRTSMKNETFENLVLISTNSNLYNKL